MGGDASPVAVSRVGGSGTRVVAAYLASIGYYLGDDLNVFMDNRWITLLFKRRSIFPEPDCVFRVLLALFVSRMSGQIVVSGPDSAKTKSLLQTRLFCGG
jgi:hypothetical protein